MPKLFVRSTEGTFDAAARAAVAARLTDLGMVCERLADRREVRDGVWVVFSEHAPDAVFRGGEPAGSATIVLQVFALEGGLDDEGRTRLIADGTAILQQHAAGSGAVPTYVVITETPEVDWGMLGEQVRLADLR